MGGFWLRPHVIALAPAFTPHTLGADYADEAGALADGAYARVGGRI